MVFRVKFFDIIECWKTKLMLEEKSTHSGTQTVLSLMKAGGGLCPDSAFFSLFGVPVNEYRSSPEVCFSAIFQHPEQM